MNGSSRGKRTPWTYVGQQQTKESNGIMQMSLNDDGEQMIRSSSRSNANLCLGDEEQLAVSPAPNENNHQ